MKKFILRIVLFFLVVGIIDYGFGVLCDYLNSHAKGGDNKSHYYVAKECNEEVLIFGSSRAVHHYMPNILADSLGMSVYNCGIEGEGILFFYPQLLTILERYTPKVIIYDIEAWYDLGTDDYSKYLGWMKRYYDTPGVIEVFDDINPMEKWMLKSNLYRYNGNITKLLIEYLHPTMDVQPDGFKPMHSVINYDYHPVNREAISFDPLKRKYFDKLSVLCKEKGVELIFVYSPTYKAYTSDVFSEMTDYCKDNNITLLDYNCDSVLAQNPKNFADVSHMNVDGAEVFSKTISNKLKELLIHK